MFRRDSFQAGIVRQGVNRRKPFSIPVNMPLDHSVCTAAPERHARRIESPMNIPSANTRQLASVRGKTHSQMLNLRQREVLPLMAAETYGRVFSVNKSVARTREVVND